MPRAGTSVARPPTRVAPHAKRLRLSAHHRPSSRVRVRCRVGCVGPRREDVSAMFERFTDRARRVVVLAQEEARMLNHNYIGTEHILLGLSHEGEGVAAKALESLGSSLELVRQRVEEIIGQGQEGPPAQLPFAPRAKKVLGLRLRRAWE